jgi:hypothetical protein
MPFRETVVVYFGNRMKHINTLCGQNVEFQYVTVRGDRLCGLVVTVLGYRSGGPGSIPGIPEKK